MRTFTTCLLLGLNCIVFAQHKKESKMIEHLILPGVLYGIAGGFEGKADQLQFHNNSNNPFWGNQSFLNKYRNRDPKQGQTFRGKYLTFTTDGFHLMRFGNHLFSAGAIALKMGDIGHKHWTYIVGELAAYWVVNRLAFYITYK